MQGWVDLGGLGTYRGFVQAWIPSTNQAQRRILIHAMNMLRQATMMCEHVSVNHNRPINKTPYWTADVECEMSLHSYTSPYTYTYTVATVSFWTKFNVQI